MGVQYSGKIRFIDRTSKSSIPALSYFQVGGMKHEQELCAALQGSLSASLYLLLVNFFYILLSDEIQITVRIPQDAYRWKRSTDEFPEDMDIDLSVGESHVTIALHRNYHISSQVPVTVERNGKIVRQFIKETQVFIYFSIYLFIHLFIRH